MKTNTKHIIYVGFFLVLLAARQGVWAEEITQVVGLPVVGSELKMDGVDWRVVGAGPQVINYTSPEGESLAVVVFPEKKALRVIVPDANTLVTCDPVKGTVSYTEKGKKTTVGSPAGQWALLEYKR